MGHTWQSPYLETSIAPEPALSFRYHRWPLLVSIASCICGAHKLTKTHIRQFFSRGTRIVLCILMLFPFLFLRLYYNPFSSSKTSHMSLPAPLEIYVPHSLIVIACICVFMYTKLSLNVSRSVYIMLNLCMFWCGLVTGDFSPTHEFPNNHSEA